ncbi:hypothetical protein [Rhodococcus tibetensis]|uniref:Uncharacterized protein n=1 Tax=Rhodococcus tibetensis TaxID=2965064 RepID=A0ABT1QAP3_9NOCA|nr:hypothetical protein [Rhodococcus sp. FXJ9.536]MCQ4118768.1 hypothetical protein [Rhodococcus sp. FXJ9.536]
MGTDILIIDDGTALGAAGHPCPRAIGVRNAEISRRHRRLGATAIDIPSLSTHHLPSAYLSASAQTCGPRALLGRIVGCCPGERHADAVRWVMARGHAIVALTDGVAGVVGYVRGGSLLVRYRRAADVVATHSVSGALTAGLLYAWDEWGLLGASAYEALRGIGLREVHDVFRDANRYGASTAFPLGSALPRHEIVLGAYPEIAI